jgi:hypothetical protein
MSETSSVTTTKSWIQRLKEALVGIIIGPVLIFVSTIVLWNNEERSAHMIAGLEEGRSVVQEGKPTTIDPVLDGTLIHISTDAITDEVLTDTDFDMSISGIVLDRRVEMYQWHEKSESRSTDNYGGSETTSTTYTYDTRWSDEKIDSKSFHTPLGHQNPPDWKYDQKSFSAKEVQVWPYALTTPMIARIEPYIPLSLEDTELTLHDGESLIGDMISIATSPTLATVGDIRITYTYTPNNSLVSILGKQEAPNILTSYIAKSTSDISRIDFGIRSAEDMFQSAAEENTLLTWIYRGVGLLFMFVGFSLFFRIIPMLLKIIPPLAWVADVGVSLVALLLTLILWGGTIALAWFFFRPIVSLVILMVIVLVGSLVIRSRKKSPPLIDSKMSSSHAYLGSTDKGSFSNPPQFDDQNFLSPSSLPESEREVVDPLSSADTDTPRR